MKKITIYPDARALAILGATAPTLNQSVECWAEVVSRATAANAQELYPAEWSYLADMLNGTMVDPGFGNPGEILAADVEDADTFDGLGAKWFGDNAPFAVPDLVAKLRALDYPRAWALVLSVQFFWANPDLSIDLEWWTLPFRLKWQRRDS